MKGKLPHFLVRLGAIALVSVITSVGSAAIDEGLLKEPFLQTSTQEQFSRELISQALPLESWARTLSSYNFICMGESHTEQHRQLMAEQLFPLLPLDHLLLEVSQEQLDNLLTRDKGFSILLGAPIDHLLRAVRRSSPGFSLWGVDVTSEQRSFSNLNPQKALSRDGWIASNILKIYQQGSKTVALYGASHCAKNNVDSGWVRPFFSMLQEALPETEKLLSVKVIVAGGKVTYPLSTENALLLYLKESSLSGTSFVLPNLQGISKSSFNSKVDFLSLFGSYDALVVLWLPMTG